MKPPVFRGIPLALATAHMAPICERFVLRARVPHTEKLPGLTKYKLLALTWVCNHEGLHCSSLYPVTGGRYAYEDGDISAHDFPLGLRGRWVIPPQFSVFETEDVALWLQGYVGRPIIISATLWLLPSPKVDPINPELLAHLDLRKNPTDG